MLGDIWHEHVDATWHPKGVTHGMSHVVKLYKWLTLSHVLNDVIKGKKEIKKIRKKNMVMTSVMEESGGKFPLFLDHPVDAIQMREEK